MRATASAPNAWLAWLRLAVGLALVAATKPAEAGGFTARPTAEDVHSRLHRQLAAAVVGISCKAKSPAGDGQGGFFGTGAVVSNDGLVLTSITVVPEDAKEIKVYFIDGRVVPAEIKRLDQDTEGVLLKVEAVGLTSLRLADSTACQPGDPAYSWGNPFQTILKDGMVSLSAGTVSGVYQLSSVDDESRYLGPVLETDAAVNPGSDGGPLTDADGNLLGIQSLAFSRSRWLGTAIPIHRLAKSMPELQKLGFAKPPDFSGPKAEAWAIERAFARLATNAAAAVVSFRVEREGEKLELPDNRTAEKLERLKPYGDLMRLSMSSLRRSPEAFSTGFIVEPDGTVVTAAYNLRDVASRSQRKIEAIYVFLADGAKVKASLLGQDAFHDIAVLKLEGDPERKYPFLPAAADASTGQGSAVAVLGRSEHAGALTLNCGFVSATGRYQDTCSQISPMINYGNLGGPAIDLQGCLVGLVARLSERTPWRQNCGVGFMLDAEVIRKILPDLKAGREVERPKRPYLGVQGDVGALDIKGARVNSVMPNTAAAEAGIEAGDIILEFNDQPIGEWQDLVKAIRSVKGGEKVKIKLKRDEEEMTVEATMGEMD